KSVQLGLVLPRAVLVGRAGTITVSYANPGNTDLPAPLILLGGDNVLYQVPGQTGYSRSALRLYGFNPSGPYRTLPPGVHGSITVSFKPPTEGDKIASNFRVSTLKSAAEPFDWDAVAGANVPINTSAQQWSAMVSQAAGLIGDTWGDVVSFIGNN